MTSGVDRQGRLPPHLGLEAEDRAQDADRRDDQMPDWAASREQRPEKIGAAKAGLQAEARVVAPDKPGERGGGGAPPDKPRRNFIDRQSRIKKTKNGPI